MSDDRLSTGEATAHPAGDQAGGRDREGLIISAFVALADTMVDEYDVIEFLGMLVERCVEMVDADEAGIMLADGRGILQAVASSSERTRLLELFELQSEEGPCLDAFTTGEMVTSVDLRDDRSRWPMFAARAEGDGFGAVVSLPLRLRRDVIGALNLLRDRPGSLTDADLALARALADVATIGLLHERAVRESRVSASQLQLALTSRVLIEQAKGVIAARLDVDIDSAFQLLRAFARRHGRKLTEVARQVVDHQLDVRQP